jgi:hypothetical protein
MASATALKCATTGSATCTPTVVAAPHTVTGTAGFNGGSSVTVTFSGAAVFTSATSYVCTVADQSSISNIIQVATTSATVITLTSQNSTSDVAAYICIGN